MSDPNDRIKIEEFLDDYFVECDEHLTHIRRNLIAIEPFAGRTEIDKVVLSDLFRSFHTIKGLSGMVMFKEAEMLSHHLENYLKALRDGHILLSSEGVSALMDGVKALEQVISAKRTGNPGPEISPVILELEKITSHAQKNTQESNKERHGKKIQEDKEASGFSLTEEQKERLKSTHEKGCKIWLFEFAPSNNLAEKGINVNSIRARLEETGELIGVFPKIEPSGGIIFEFITASQSDEKIFDKWKNDGLSYSLYKDVDSDERSGKKVEEPKVQISHVSPSNVLRVDLGRLEEVMQMVGGLVISRSRLDSHIKSMESVMPASGLRTLQEINLALERQIRDLREEVMRIRMVPIGDIFTRMQFVIHDLARESGKKIRLELKGQETEIDKFVVERMLDPLLHLVRNAITHGIEPVEERKNAGKPEEGKIFLRASTAGDIVIIEIEDDGRGLDLYKIAQKARELGVLQSNELPDMSGILDILCEPGFSTKQEADLGSGRGVGMNIVSKTVRELGGSMTVKSELLKGTVFIIELPLTLAIVDALIVKVGAHTFAVPQPSVHEVIEISEDEIKILENNEIIFYRGGVLPLVKLSELFDLKGDNAGSFHALVAGSSLGAVGIVVDTIKTRREIVVRALTDPLVHVSGISGATELGDGRAVLILDTGSIMKSAKAKRKPAQKSV